MSMTRRRLLATGAAAAIAGTLGKPPLARADDDLWASLISSAGDEVLGDVRERALDAAARAALIADAELAWQYFARSGESFDGLVPGTAALESGKVVARWPYATLWDFGSHVLAAVSAHRLGIIDDDEFDRTVNRIIAFLGDHVIDVAGFKMPPGVLALTDGRPAARGFDAYDTGRFLVSLSVLDSYAPNRFPIRDLLSKWELEGAIVDGLMYGIRPSGAFVLAQHNAYSPYIRRGYVAWGIEVTPVHDDFGTGAEADKMLLIQVAQRGRVSTEGIVTEKLEVGDTHQARLVADVLYAAQIKRHRSTGLVTSVSEVPLDVRPYFAYYGYQITEDGGYFTVDGRNPSEQTILDYLGDRSRLVSTKACYMWYAARPGRYSDKLLAHARQAGRINGLGFSPGIREIDGVAIAFSDINTNAMILEVAAYIANGSRPLADMEIAGT